MNVGSAKATPQPKAKAEPKPQADTFEELKMS
jgi:hypothetical protein